MIDYNEVNGDLIELAKEGQFDAIAHGCNCMSTMGAGIALQMAKEFKCDRFKMETEWENPGFEKLGNIDYNGITYGNIAYRISNPNDYYTEDVSFTLVNAYTQFGIGYGSLDYEALTLCMRKINSVFKHKHIGLPQIGAGLAGGEWNRIKEIIKQELKDCKVTVVIYDKK
jgi:O-acetyl-ADP-ribose deacetylase (regulator of RNase III)